MKNLTDKLEAILFSHKGGLTLSSIERIIDASRESLEKALEDLRERYEKIDGALEIRIKDNLHKISYNLFSAGKIGLRSVDSEKRLTYETYGLNLENGEA